jgi:hypothetical protein
MTLLQAAVNGDRSKADHPAVPVTEDELIRDVQECLAAGAREFHVHVRDADGQPTWIRGRLTGPPQAADGKNVPCKWAITHARTFRSISALTPKPHDSRQSSRLAAWLDRRNESAISAR